MVLSGETIATAHLLALCFYFVYSPQHSPSYGLHWTRDKIVDLTRNSEAHSAILGYLDANGIQVITETSHGEYITAEAPIKQWEEILGAQFFEYQMEKYSSNLLRASQYVKHL